MNHEFLPDAEKEYLDAVRFYEDRQQGLGASLIAEFEHSLSLALERPLAWRLAHQSGIRCIGLSRFPYSIYYKAANNNLLITAFAHHRRRPGYWKNRR